MGRAIEMENRQDELEKRLKLVEDALEEMIQTKVHHVDLHKELDKHEKEIRKENLVVGEDEVFTPPAGKRKKTIRKSRTVNTT